MHRLTPLKLLFSCLYFYTILDSIIYVSRENEADIPTGVYLGEMVNELEAYGEDAYITEFCSGGAKNYAFEVLSPSTGTLSRECKIKGITLNYEACKYVNFEVIRKMVLESTEIESVKVPLMQFRRSRKFEVQMLQQEKTYRIVNTKRKFKDHTSLPYGYAEPATSDFEG